MIRGSHVSSLHMIVTALVCGGVVAACSGSGGKASFDDPKGQGTDKADGSAGGGGPGDPGGGGGTFGDDAGGGGDASCAAESSKAKQQPLDIYIMLDQSGSMTEMVAGGGTKWTAVSTALKTFVGQPSLAGVGVGLQYFGLPPSGGSMCPTSVSTSTW